MEPWVVLHEVLTNGHYPTLFKSGQSAEVYWRGLCVPSLIARMRSYT
jgi:hypothetical protein